jgi:hypothetical protein
MRDSLHFSISLALSLTLSRTDSLPGIELPIISILGHTIIEKQFREIQNICILKIIHLEYFYLCSNWNEKTVIFSEKFQNHNKTLLMHWIIWCLSKTYSLGINGHTSDCNKNSFRFKLFTNVSKKIRNSNSALTFPESRIKV